MKKILFLIFILINFSWGLFVQAAETFSAGPVIAKFGKHAEVELSEPIDKTSSFKIAFDVSERSGEDNLNRRFETLARFINMHVANGIPLKNIDLALVVHGKAGFDLLKTASYQARFEQQNPSAELVKVLLANGVKIFLCGQSAAYYDIASQDLINNVQMSLSAMTANALLSQQGYSLNPF